MATGERGEWRSWGPRAGRRQREHEAVDVGGPLLRVDEDGSRITSGRGTERQPRSMEGLRSCETEAEAMQLGEIDQGERPTGWPLVRGGAAPSTRPTRTSHSAFNARVRRLINGKGHCHKSQRPDAAGSHISVATHPPTLTTVGAPGARRIAATAARQPRSCPASGTTSRHQFPASWPTNRGVSRHRGSIANR